MGLLSKEEIADYIWNEGILPLITSSIVLNAEEEYDPTGIDLATTTFTQNVGSWTRNNSTDNLWVYGPAGYNAKDGHEQEFSGAGPRLNLWSSAFEGYWYSASAYGTDVGCTIYGSNGAYATGTFGNQTHTLTLKIDGAWTADPVDTTDAYNAYIDFLTAKGWFNTDFEIVNSRSYGFALMCAVEFLTTSMYLVPWESGLSESKYVFMANDGTSATAFTTSLLSDLGASPTVSNSGISDIFTGILGGFGERMMFATNLRIAGATATCSSCSSSSCSSSSSSSSCSSSSCSSSSCSSSCSSSIFIAYYNLVIG